MIINHLGSGAEHARTGRQIATELGIDIRTLNKMIERERRAGNPICANAKGINRGYYIAANENELEAYCSRLEHRANELLITRNLMQSITL